MFALKNKKIIKMRWLKKDLQSFYKKKYTLYTIFI